MLGTDVHSERLCLAYNGGNKKRNGLKCSIYPTLQTLQTATTLESQITPFCFLLRVIGCLFLNEL